MAYFPASILTGVTFCCWILVFTNKASDTSIAIIVKFGSLNACGGISKYNGGKGLAAVLTAKRPEIVTPEAILGNSLFEDDKQHK